MMEKKVKEKAKASLKLSDLPKKTKINLAMKEKKTASLYTMIIGVILITVVSVAVAKFGVIDQLARLEVAESEYNKVHNQYLQTSELASSYDAVTAEYRMYSREWLLNDTTGKFVTVERTKILDLIEKDLMGKGTINSISVYGDRAVIEMSGMTLREISEMFRTVEQEPIVMNAVLNIASTEEQQALSSILDFSITIQLQKAVEEGAES